MKKRILFVERKFDEFVSIEKAFRQIANELSEMFHTEFQQVRFGSRFSGVIGNLLFFRKKRADIYHITGHINYLALLFSPRNSILSIMDLRFIRNPGVLRRFFLKKLYLDWPVKHLKYITTISEQVRNEIIQQTGCDENKVRTLDLPLFDHIFAGDEKVFNNRKPVILQIGTMPNKNIHNLAIALKGIDCKLRIVGRMNPDLASVLKENQIEYEAVSDIDDEALRNEYKNADMVAFCSTYEGFGLPIIEAQSMRKPLITSNISPMKETAGSAAFLADPQDPANIREGILKIISDEKYRNQLVFDGQRNVEKFKPAIIANQYLKLYEEVLNARER